MKITWSRAESLRPSPPSLFVVMVTGRRDFEETAMMPYQTYQLYDIQRPKSAAEIRSADERAGRIAAAIAELLLPLARASRMTGSPRVARCPDPSRHRAVAAG